MAACRGHCYGKTIIFVFSTFHITFRDASEFFLSLSSSSSSSSFFFPDLPFVASPMLRVIATSGRLMHDSRIGNNNKQVVKVFSLPENADFTRKVGTKLVSNRAVCNRIYAAARKTHLQLVSLVFLKG